MSNGDTVKYIRMLYLSPEWTRHPIFILTLEAFPSLLDDSSFRHSSIVVHCRLVKLSIRIMPFNLFTFFISLAGITSAIPQAGKRDSGFDGHATFNDFDSQGNINCKDDRFAAAGKMKVIDYNHIFGAAAGDLSQDLSAGLCNYTDSDRAHTMEGIWYNPLAPFPPSPPPYEPLPPPMLVEKLDWAMEADITVSKYRGCTRAIIQTPEPIHIHSTRLQEGQMWHLLRCPKQGQ